MAAGLTEMRGATAPRLLLELICARVLLPGADHSTDGLMARLDRLEKRASIAGGAPSPAPVREDPAPAARPAPRRPGRGARDDRAGRRARRRRRRSPASPSPQPEPEPPSPSPQPEPGPRRARAAPSRSPSPAPEPAPAAAPRRGALSLVDVRRLWPDIVEATKMRRRVAWIHLTQNSQVVGVDGTTLTLGFANAGARDSFVNGGCDEILRQAAIDVVGVDWQVETIVDPGAAGGTPTPPPPRPRAAAAGAARRRRGRAGRGSAAPDVSAAAREAIRTTRAGGPGRHRRRPTTATGRPTPTPTPTTPTPTPRVSPVPSCSSASSAPR